MTGEVYVVVLGMINLSEPVPSLNHFTDMGSVPFKASCSGSNCQRRGPDQVRFELYAWVILLNTVSYVFACWTLLCLGLIFYCGRA